MKKIIILGVFLLLPVVFLIKYGQQRIVLNQVTITDPNRQQPLQQEPITNISYRIETRKKYYIKN